MSEARVLPLLGAVVGALLGLVITAVMTAAGVIAPDRLPLFGAVGLGIILGAAILTQRITLAKKRLVGAIVVGALFVGVALTGIPEVARGGTVSTGCMATGTSSLEPNPVTPSDTTAVDGFSVTPEDTIEWTTQTSVPVPDASARVSMQVGGFGIPLRTFQFAEAPEVTTWEGTQSVEPQLAAIQDSSGFFVTGIYQVSVHVEADTGECTANAYLHVAPDGPFDTLLLKLLWALSGILVIALLVLTIVVRRSIRESDRSLAMVGMSAIPGETSTTPPATPPSPTSTTRLSEPSQPTAPETSGENAQRRREHTGGTNPGDRPASPAGERASRAPMAGAAVPAEQTERSDDPAPAGDPVAEEEPAAEGEPARAGDERIGEGNVTNETESEGDTDRPAQDP